MQQATHVGNCITAPAAALRTWLAPICEQTRVPFFSRVQVSAGDTLLLPSGCLYASAAPCDCILAGGHFWHPFSLHAPLRVFELQEALGQKPAVKLPGMQPLFWSVLLHYARYLRQFAGLPLMRQAPAAAGPKHSGNAETSLLARSSAKRKAPDGPRTTTSMDDFTSPPMKQPRQETAQTEGLAGRAAPAPTPWAAAAASGDAAAGARRPSQTPSAQPQPQGQPPPRQASHRPARSEMSAGAPSASGRPKRAAAAGVERLLDRLLASPEGSGDFTGRDACAKERVYDSTQGQVRCVPNACILYLASMHCVWCMARPSQC